jgi:hypothetical protein
MKVMPGSIPDHQYGVPKDYRGQTQNQEMTQEAFAPTPADL